MTIKVLYFASVREAIGLAAEDVALPVGVATLGELRDYIATRGAPWDVLTRTKNLRGAIGQQMKSFDASIKDGDEVAFFPPVTGG